MGRVCTLWSKIRIAFSRHNSRNAIVASLHKLVVCYNLQLGGISFRASPTPAEQKLCIYIIIEFDHSRPSQDNISRKTDVIVLLQENNNFGNWTINWYLHLSAMSFYTTSNV